MTSYNPPYGFALRRNGSCLPSEASCGPTWGDFSACCPGSSFCPGSVKTVYNNVCCPSEEDCTADLLGAPHCASETWTLFYHDYFCCLPGQTGFWTSDPEDAVGCSNGPVNDSDYTELTPLTTSAFSTSTFSTSTTPPISSSSNTASPSPIHGISVSTPAPSSSSTGNDKGEIAGGVIGGTIGIALIIAALWYYVSVWRRRRREGEATRGGEKPEETVLGMQEKTCLDNSKTLQVGGAVSELDGLGQLSEIGNSGVQAVFELPQGK